MDLAGKQAGAGPPERLNISVSGDWGSGDTPRLPLPPATRREQSNLVSPNGLCRCQLSLFILLFLYLQFDVYFHPGRLLFATHPSDRNVQYGVLASNDPQPTHKHTQTHNSYADAQESQVRSLPWLIGKSESTVYMDTKQNDMVMADVYKRLIGVNHLAKSCRVVEFYKNSSRRNTCTSASVANYYRIVCTFSARSRFEPCAFYFCSF